MAGRCAAARGSGRGTSWVRRGAHACRMASAPALRHKVVVIPANHVHHNASSRCTVMVVVCTYSPARWAKVSIKSRERQPEVMKAITFAEPRRFSSATKLSLAASCAGTVTTTISGAGWCGMRGNKLSIRARRTVWPCCTKARRRPGAHVSFPTPMSFPTPIRTCSDVCGPGGTGATGVHSAGRHRSEAPSSSTPVAAAPPASVFAAPAQAEADARFVIRFLDRTDPHAGCVPRGRGAFVSALDGAHP